MVVIRESPSHVSHFTLSHVKLTQQNEQQNMEQIGEPAYMRCAQTVVPAKKGKLLAKQEVWAALEGELSSTYYNKNVFTFSPQLKSKSFKKRVLYKK